ncbi:MAG: hypothetical protein AB1631_13850 [Acidobacteriota bacterium]
MKRLIQMLIIAGILLSQVSNTGLAQSESLGVYVSAWSPRGEAIFLRGAPIQLTVSLVNTAFLQAEAKAREQWLRKFDQAVKEGEEPPPAPEPSEPPQETIKVGNNNFEWIEWVQIHVERIRPNPGPVLEGVRWIDTILFPRTLIAGEVTVGKDPVWATFEITPAMSAGLQPGQYRIAVSYPDASANETMIDIKSVETDGEQATLDYELAKRAVSRSDYDGAIQHAQRAIGKLPSDHDMLYLILGDAYAGKQDWAKAIEAYEKFLNTYEDSETWAYPSFVRNVVERLKEEVRIPVIAEASYIGKLFKLSGRGFTRDAQVEINGRLIALVFSYDPATTSLNVKAKRRKLNLKTGENQIVVIEDGKRSLPFLLRL